MRLMWIKRNPNPKHKNVNDCVVRAVSIALNRPWREVHWELCLMSAQECDMPSSDAVWGKYLYWLGFEPFLLPAACPSCVTVNEFTHYFPFGTYIIGTGHHAVAVINGNYYDTWDSGQEVPTYFWKIQ